MRVLDPGLEVLTWAATLIEVGLEVCNKCVYHFRTLRQWHEGMVGAFHKEPEIPCPTWCRKAVRDWQCMLRVSLIGETASRTDRSRNALTVAGLAKQNTRRQRMSPRGVNPASLSASP